MRVLALGGAGFRTSIKGSRTGRGAKSQRSTERASCNIPIIGTGGIADAADVRAYQEAGADFFGIGTALLGFTEEEIKDFFAQLARISVRGLPAVVMQAWAHLQA